MAFLLDGEWVLNKQRYTGTPDARRNKSKKSKKKLLLIPVSFLLLILIALVVVQPYRRIESLAGRLLIEQAPPGTRFERVSISFPSRITITKLDVPVRINNHEQRFRLEKMSGNISLTPLLKGEVEAEMNSDFFGGVLWVKVKSNGGNSSGGEDKTTYEARARQMDLAQLCDFLDASVPLRGSVDVDAEGTVNGLKPASASGQALALGKKIEIPQIEVDPVVLPANHSAELVAKLTSDSGKVSIQDFRLTGSAYDIAGTGKIDLAEKLPESTLDCSPNIVFKERFVVTDRRLSGVNVDGIVDALIKSKSKMYFRVTGTLAEPQAELDSASSLGPLLNYLNK